MPSFPSSTLRVLYGNYHGAMGGLVHPRRSHRYSQARVGCLSIIVLPKRPFSIVLQSHQFEYVGTSLTITLVRQNYKLWSIWAL